MIPCAEVSKNGRIKFFFVRCLIMTVRFLKFVGFLKLAECNSKCGTTADEINPSAEVSRNHGITFFG